MVSLRVLAWTYHMVKNKDLRESLQSIFTILKILISGSSVDDIRLQKKKAVQCKICHNFNLHNR
jgi:hypothetical protein